MCSTGEFDENLEVYLAYEDFSELQQNFLLSLILLLLFCPTYANTHFCPNFTSFLKLGVILSGDCTLVLNFEKSGLILFES